MDVKLPKKVRELSISGEQCWPTFVNEISGEVRLGYIDPGEIETVVTDPHNIEQNIGIVTKRDKHGRRKRFRIIVNGPESVFTASTQKIRESFDDGDCFFSTINALSNSSRGSSDVLSLVDLLDAYEQALFGELERWSFLRHFFWDITLKGATKEEIMARAKQLKPPSPGSNRIHNDNEEWKAVSVDLNAEDTNAIASLIRNHILQPQHSRALVWRGWRCEPGNRQRNGRAGDQSLHHATARAEIHHRRRRNLRSPPVGITRIRRLGRPATAG
jgi:hypothetical protein